MNYVDFEFSEDKRSLAQKQLDQMLEDRDAFEQGNEPYKILYQIAIELLEKQNV